MEIANLGHLGKARIYMAGAALTVTHLFATAAQVSFVSHMIFCTGTVAPLAGALLVSCFITTGTLMALPMMARWCLHQASYHYSQLELSASVLLSPYAQTKMAEAVSLSSDRVKLVPPLKLDEDNEERLERTSH